MCRQMELEELLEIGQAAAQILPVAPACFAEGGELLNLLPADGCLNVERLQVITEVGVDVLVIVAEGQFAELPAKAFTAGVVLAARAPAIAAPVAEAFD